MSLSSSCLNPNEMSNADGNEIRPSRRRVETPRRRKLEEDERKEVARKRRDKTVCPEHRRRKIKCTHDLETRGPEAMTLPEQDATLNQRSTIEQGSASGSHQHAEPSSAYYSSPYDVSDGKADTSSLYLDPRLFDGIDQDEGTIKKSQVSSLKSKGKSKLDQKPDWISDEDSDQNTDVEPNQENNGQRR